MISFDRAQQLLRNLDLEQEVETLSAEDAPGRVLAQTIVAREDVPGFRKSAMDGYAVRKVDLEGAAEDDPVELEEIGTVEAGHSASNQLTSGTTLRIFTGAPVPPGADAVVMQERVERTEGNTVQFTEPARRSNIRQKGEELEEGDVLLEKGTVLNPAAVGLLMEQGYTGVPVVRSPSAAVVNTGDELIPADGMPSMGQLRDSIGPALSVLLRQEFISPERRRVNDDREELATSLESLITDKNLVMVSGGVSVGDRDLTRDVLQDLGVEPLFWKVKQKPGKPVYLGRRGNTLVLGLPGNPVSSLVCYYLYGRPLIRKWRGFPEGQCRLPVVETEVSNNDVSRRSRTVFARARTVRTVDGYRSECLEHQGSHMLSGLAKANSLVRVPAEENKQRTRHEAYLLPERLEEVLG
jgi:molybdopterin molybdotransferase